MEQAPRVFVSYSQDSPQHAAAVRGLVEELRQDGVDARLDAYSQPDHWPRWMAREIAEADFVLVVCTEAYGRRFEGKELPNAGLGATWEGHIITQAIYEAGGSTGKFVPVLMRSSDLDHRPTALRAATYYLVDRVEGYERLYATITGQTVPQPELGLLRAPRPEVALPPVPKLPRAESGPSSISSLVSPEDLARSAGKNLFDRNGEGELLVSSVADLNADGADEIVLLGRRPSQEGDCAVVEIWSPSGQDSTWVRLLSDELLGGGARLAEIDVFLAPLTHDGRLQVVAFSRMGSGSFLDYRIYGIEERRASVLWEEESLFQGRVWLRAGLLVVGQGGLNSIVSWDGEKFVRIPAKLRPDAPSDAVTVSYRITENRVEAPRSLRLTVGQRFCLARVDLEGGVERIMFGAAERIIDCENDVCTAVGVGATYIAIIPNGYDSDNAASIEVVVTEPGHHS